MSAAPFRDDIDFSKLHVIGFDHAGTYAHFKHQQTDLYEIIMEFFQNAIDSKDLGEPNKITVKRNRHPVADPKNEPIFEGSDEGLGICQDYDNNITEFIEALKADSKKPRKKHKGGSKGIGMLQYTNIGKTVVFTSMYEGLISRFALTETNQSGKPLGAFTIPKTVAATDQNKQLYRIHENGTHVAFYDRDPGLPWIQTKKLITTTQKEYAMRLAENPDLQVIIDGKRVRAPDWIKNHPPELLFTTSKGYEVRGAIWADTKGNGNITYFRGHRVLERLVDPRQCTGYLECWELKPDTPRVSFELDDTWVEIDFFLRQRLRQFPNIKDDPTHKKQLQNTTDMATAMLQDMIPQTPVQYGSIKDTTKQPQTGDLHGTGSLGYRKQNPADPNRVKKKRKKGGKHKNRGQIGDSGTDDVNKGTQDLSKRTQESRLKVNEVEYSRKPLLQLFNEPDRIPAILTVNKANDEYPIYKMTFQKDPKSYNYLFGVWISEIRKGVDDDIRMDLSDERVNMWKIIGRYPKTTYRQHLLQLRRQLQQQEQDPSIIEELEEETT